MNKNLVIVMVGGFLIAILVALIVQAGLKDNKKAAVQIKEEPRVSIVVAAKALPVGTKLDETNIKWQEWPKNAVFPGAVVKEGDKKPVEMVSGRLKRALAEGEPVLPSALVKEDAGNFLAATLGDGMRAVAVDVTAVKSAGGFISPGDYVDIILTYKESIKYKGGEDFPQIGNMVTLNLGKSAAETILQNVKVLAVDQAPKRDEEAGVKVGKTVTLEVDLRGAEILALSRSMGDLTLALRRLGDNKIYARNYPVISDSRLTNISDEIYDKIVKMENEASQDQDIVRIYKGNSVDQTPVSGP